VEQNPRPLLGAPCPGTDPGSLWVITAAVLAGLVISGIVVVSHGWPAAGSPDKFSHAGAQAMAVKPGAPSGLLAGQAMDTGPVTHTGPRAAAGPVKPAGSGGLAVRLLSQAALASQRMPYEGVEVLAGWSRAGPATSVVDVWHSAGGVTLTRSAAPVPGWQGEVPHILLPPSSVTSQALVGAAMLGMTQRLVRMLSANYRLAAVGWGQVAGRRARLVTASWRRGGLAARFWLDEATTLPLRRQTYDGRGQLVSDAAFARVKLGYGVGLRLAATKARPWGDTLASAQLSRLRAQGWPLPGPLPGDMALLGAREDITPAGRVVDLDYSDGLSLVSVFVQRGHLPPRMDGWSQVALRGIPVYTDDADGQSIAWSASGFVYTVVAAAPPQTVGQVVAALPHDASPGFLARLKQGLHRLLSWIVP
jgi:negative regulator of sigma E activity